VYGAGILADPAQGRVLTSLHVIEDMKSPRVTTRDGRKATAKVVRKDTTLDLALLEAPELVSPALERPRFVDVATLRPGEDVYAIGRPRKLPFSVSRGVVGYIDRDMDGGRYVQLDMNINEGNSGGPVFNRHGEVVGVMSFILRRSQGLAFALPATDALAAFNELRPTPPPTQPAAPTAPPAAPTQRASSAP
jgi:serine protease Do